MRFVTIILSIVIFTSCFSGKKNDIVTDRSAENIPAYLDSIIPYMANFATGKDTIYDMTRHEDGYILQMIGKFIDGKNIYALSYNDKDTLLNFYHFDIPKAEWKQIGSERPVWEEIFDISIEDMDGDNRNEVVTFSHPNMNGNTFKEIYYFSKKNDSVHIAAGFFTSSYEVDKIAKTVKTDYAGSWYMPLERCLYRWHGEKLILEKAMVLELKVADMKCSEQILTYYENPSSKESSDLDSLRLVYKIPYIEDKHQHLWDDFFLENK